MTTTILKFLPDVKAIYLFGSYAHGQALPDSDIDLAVINDEPMDENHFFEMILLIATALNRDIDLIDIKRTPLDMKFEIISTGVLIYDKNPQQTLEYETLIMSMYQRFNEERSGILEEIVRSGKILS